ncbi:MAG: anhydro-N-acetylmuramic acid kinase [Gammaproteobacteria bacterium]|nr:MAG: anhydro-N-acetylmuramic acid kinase [Gammaproteobacteria bacterium]
MRDPSLYIGLMSGTSLDGVDAALVDFAATPPALLAVHCSPYPGAFRRELLSRITPDASLSWAEIARLDHALAEQFASAVRGLLERAGPLPGTVRAIGSHGQTVWHAPGGTTANSLQLGDPAYLAVTTGIPVVADFRRADIAAGGQGAPLVPAFHAALFRDREEDRAVLNLGGIANLTCLPADPMAPVTGFDTGPGNLLLDAWCQAHTGAPYDREGAWARRGRPVPELLAAWLSDPYFAAPPPKSTGREYFHLGWLQAAGTRLEAYRPEDVQATLVALTAHTVADALHRYCPARPARLLVCGGGARNPALMAALQEALPGVVVEPTDALGLAAEWVEAAAFAWLAKRRIEGKPGNLPEVTGARRRVVLGGLHLP